MALALLLLEIELSILSIRQRRTFDTISLIWGIFFFTCLLDIIYVPWFVGKERTEWNWVVSLLMRLPWLVVIGIEILTLTVVIIVTTILITALAVLTVALLISVILSVLTTGAILIVALLAILTLRTFYS